MTTLDDVKAQHVYLTGKALGLVEKKGADYNRKQQNAIIHPMSYYVLEQLSEKN